MTAIPLPFDSQLFNYPVGKIIIGDDPKEEELQEFAQEYQLLYLFSKTPLTFNNPNLHLVDTKIIFEKSLENVNEVPEVSFYAGPLTKEVEDLAYLSGKYSRFRTDPRLQNEEFEKLYKIWISKAFEGNHILSPSNLEGLVTFGVENEKASIGLIAVAEQYQGRGWGKKLVQAAEWHANKSGAVTMQIPTQENNLPACKLYRSLGYKVVERDYVYHYWKKTVLT